MVPKLSYKGGGFMLWFLQRLTGVVLLVLIFIHFFYFHIYLHFAEQELNFAEVSGRLGAPFWKTFDILFLFNALFHGLNGVWMIASDYVSYLGKFLNKFGIRVGDDGIKLAILCALIVLGMVLAILGLLTVVTFKP